MAELERFFQDMVSGKETGLAARALLAFLKGASFPYAAVLRLRAAAYQHGLLRSHRLPVPVISVGNIVLGGTGKTPVTMQVARHFLERGRRVCVLSRGYGGSSKGKISLVSDGSRIFLGASEAGDEPYLLASKVPGLMVVIGGDRYRAGLFAMEKLNPDLFILDDGFQHLRLKRDLNILLLDAARPFSNGCTVPGGFLREPAGAAQRADLVLYTRAAQRGAPHLFPGKPSFWARHALGGMVPLGGKVAEGFEPARGKKVAAFSGIANPDAFFELLQGSGITPAATLAFPDHARYGEGEVAAIRKMKEESGASILVTTEKDAVKLAPYREELAPCYAAQLEIECIDDAHFRDTLEKML
ncbi:tetraacyldisaccharide 4'-kinase [Geomonas sp. RF6]|uniref:tetraacyldisaccharide 4'-kinase n=1 Tax=Geomonas sp. RF6 TaxID=2897342 RepID=UPI001E4B9E42|nr:tetraacyldisaccharide 4'-kinase [Geomonas sp. RF6]UFS68637.1 tetraacyldisaccharide 4'-kinase [Geomonas sp. RF6]